jgi:hypothetical protein
MRAATSDFPLVCGDIGWLTDDGRSLWAISIIQMCIWLFCLAKNFIQE